MHYIGYKLTGFNLLGIGIACLFMNLPMIWGVVLIGALVGVVEVAWKGYFNVAASTPFLVLIPLSFGITYGVFTANTLHYEQKVCYVDNVTELMGERKRSCYFVVVRNDSKGEGYYINEKTHRKGNIPELKILNRWLATIGIILSNIFLLIDDILYYPYRL